MSSTIVIRLVVLYPDMPVVLYGSGVGGLFRGLFRMAIPFLKKGFNIAKPHLKAAAKNIVTDVFSNALTRSYNDNAKTQDGSGLMVMDRKRMSKPPGIRRRGHTIKKKKTRAKKTSVARRKLKKTVRRNIAAKRHSSSTYTYRCIIESLLNYSKDTLESLFSAGLFFKDTAGHMDVTDPAGRNVGLTKRWNYTAGSKGKDDFCLMTDEDTAYKLNILSASLFIKKVSVSPSVRLAHAQTLLSNTAKYPIDRVCLKHFSIPAGSRVSNQENLFLGTLPKSIVLGMVDNDAFTGTYTKNPFAFNHYDLEFLAVYVDGQQFPAKPLQPNFESGSAVREFYQLATTTGRHLKNQALSINRDDFLNGYTLYAFNLTPDEDCGQHISLIRSGNIRLEARFKKPLPHTVNHLRVL
ncbi:hypothetical protein QQF64_034189 [Cirrhinus molitorella]|uniref:Capsid protein n=1 Tax=Cirrhinus molitorella TaxID=172907 RepID=A0ABR3MVY9_9TELE